MEREGMLSASSKKENDYSGDDCADNHLEWVRGAELGSYLYWKIPEDEITSEEGANSM